MPSPIKVALVVYAARALRVVAFVALFLLACAFSMYVVALDLAWYGGNP